MDLDLECVASFLVLRDEGHFGRAAARLNLTSPALTKRIQKLEREVGVPLVTRGASGAALTAAGWRFAEHAASALEQARAARAAAREAAEHHAHLVLRVGVPGTASSDAMLRAVVSPIDSHRARVPGVALRVVGLPFDDFVRSVLRGAIDILWSPSPVTHPALSSSPVGAGPRVGVLPRGHPLATASTISGTRFAELPILYNPVLPSETMAPATLGDVRPVADAHLVRTTAQCFAALREEVIRGRGVVVLPEMLSTGLGPDLVPVALEGVAPATTFAVHRRSDRRPLLREVLDMLVELGGPHRPGPRPGPTGRSPDAEGPSTAGAGAVARHRADRRPAHAAREPAGS